jgi:hypothetical protein
MLQVNLYNLYNTQGRLREGVRYGDHPTKNGNFIQTQIVGTLFFFSFFSSCFLILNLCLFINTTREAPDKRVTPSSKHSHSFSLMLLLYMLPVDMYGC